MKIGWMPSGFSGEAAEFSELDSESVVELAGTAESKSWIGVTGVLDDSTALRISAAKQNEKVQKRRIS